MTVLFSQGTHSRAEDASQSVNVTGMTGLNTVPTARFDVPGTVRAGVATSDPYNHAFLGIQIGKPLYVNLRQSMEVSDIGATPKMVYPGMDFKLRLAQEGRYRPEIAFGMNSALGNRRFSSEYLALSKRFYDFDFTLGTAWGRMGSGGHIKNPLSRISSHFDHDRDYNDQDASSPGDWFSGNEMGFFGGVEYFTPVKGLSLKADFNGDAYKGETLSTDFKKPSPWSVGFNYSPKEWVSFGMSAIGADKLMARLTFQGNPSGWGRKSYKDTEPQPLYTTRPPRTTIGLAREMAKDQGIDIGKIETTKSRISAVLHLNDYQPAALQIGRAARLLSGNAARGIESIAIVPVSAGLEGKAVTFSRRDLEQALVHGTGSPEEIWQDTEFSDSDLSTSKRAKRQRIIFAPEMQLSLGEEETTHLYRASLLAEEKKNWNYGITTGSAVRLNIANNLSRLSKFKELRIDPVRSDADLFAMNRINLDRAYVTAARTPLPNVHAAVTAGYLEEMYAGIGGEVLYRPFQSPLALGIEAWKAYKRDPLTPLALGIGEQSATTGFFNAFYEIPDTDITAFAKVGRFLGGDFGLNTGAKMDFGGGMKLTGSVSVTNAHDKDVFNSDRNLYAGVNLTIPLGDIKYVPQGSEARMKVAPIGRNDAAILDKPFDLYEATEPASYRHLARSWQEVLE